ncbi:zinc finger protein 333 isoform X3 [Equus asinus]|uniref:zinc finger protein 333 isoform X3 n=1 Tax=Equus asinus TaxID=9793 RepID=UPI0038F6AFA9
MRILVSTWYLRVLIYGLTGRRHGEASVRKKIFMAYILESRGVAARTGPRGAPGPTGVDWSERRVWAGGPWVPAGRARRDRADTVGVGELGLDPRMQIRPGMGERETPSVPEDRPALWESPWTSGYTELKAAVQIQRAAMPVPALGLPNWWGAGGSALPAQDPMWHQEASAEKAAVTLGVLTACPQEISCAHPAPLFIWSKERSRGPPREDCAQEPVQSLNFNRKIQLLTMIFLWRFHPLARRGRGLWLESSFINTPNLGHPFPSSRSVRPRGFLPAGTRADAAGVARPSSRWASWRRRRRGAGTRPSPAASVPSPSGTARTSPGTRARTARRGASRAASAGVPSSARPTCGATRARTPARSPSRVPSAARPSRGTSTCCCTAGATRARSPMRARPAGRPSTSRRPCAAMRARTRARSHSRVPTVARPSASPRR